jgi:putative PIN family toxin of toxin-antitoxin system
MGPRVVLDTNVVVSAFRSRQGASYALLEQVGSGRFTTCLSVPLMLEYESVLLRHLRDTGLTRGDVEVVLDFLGLAGEPCAVYFRWRPYLKDADDDMVLELAVAAGCSRIVTHNVRHFRDLPHFSVEAVTPSRFLREIGDLPWVR